MTLAATTVWELRTDGAATNGGGYKSNAGTTDYSQQAAAQLAVTDLACVTGGAVCTNTVGDFTAAMVGSICYIAGTHFVTGWYEIVTYTNAHQITLDRDPTDGSNGSAGTCNVGGALNGIGTLGLVLSTAAQSVSGMKAYVRGGTYSLTNTVVNTDGGPLDLDTSLQGGKAFYLKGYATDAATRDDFTGTRPVIDCNDQAPTNVIELQGANDEPHIVAFLDILGDAGTSRAINGIVGNSYNTDRAISCIVRDCDGTYAYNGIVAINCFADSCAAGGFSGTIAIGCIARSCEIGFGNFVSINCTAIDCSGDGFATSYPICVGCVSYNGGADGFDQSSGRAGIFINCVSYSDAVYAFNTVAETILMNCASDGAGSGRTPVATAPWIDVGNPGALTGDPFSNAASLLFDLDNTTNEGNLLREAGASPYGQTGSPDIGAVQTLYPAAADVRYGVSSGSATGALEIPNTDAPTGTQDETSDACVVSGKKYGSPQRTGSAAGGGGYTYGDEDQAYVLTTADGAGTYQPVAAADVRAGTDVGVSPAVGTLAVPIAGDVRFGEDVDATTGTCYVPAAADVRFGTDVDATTGTAYIPAAADVEFGVDVDATTGTFTSPAVGKVIDDTSWGAGGVEFTGTYHPTEVAEVLDSVSFGALSAETGTYHAPEAAEVISTAVFGPASGTPGAYDVSDVAEGNIIVGVSIGGVAGTYPLTATTQAADAAILEAEKAYLLATKTITFGASSVIGTLAVSNVLTAVTGGTFDSTNLSVGNVIQDVTFGVGLTGTGANLMATHTTYLSLEAGRNSTTAAAGQILSTYSVTIAGSTTNGTYVPIAQANARKTGAGYYGVGGAVDGTCYVPGAADVRKTVAVDATTGTLVGIVDSAGARTDYGCCSAAQARTAAGIVHDAGTVNAYGTLTAASVYAASGILHSLGTYNAHGIYDGDTYFANGVFDNATTTRYTLAYATEAAGGTYHEAELGEVKDGVFFGAGSLLEGTYSPGGTFTEGQANQLATDIAEVNTHLADIRKTIVVLTGADAGTLVGIVDSTGTQHNYGTCSSTQAWDVDGIIHTSGTAATSGILTSGGGYYAAGILADANTYYAYGTFSLAGAYNATGVIYGTGSYATEASRNVDPGEAYVLTGHDYTILGAAKSASYSPDFPAVENVLTIDTVNGSSGTFSEAARNTDPGEANVADGVSYKILNVDKEGTLVGGDYATGYADGKAYIVAGLVLPATYLVDAPTMYGVNLAGYEAYYLEGTGLNQATLTAALSAAGLTLPTGTYACTWTVNDGTTALQGATVSFWLAGVLRGTGTTNASGTVPMSFDAGTYTVAISLSGYTFANTTHTVSSTASTWTKTFSMTAIAITPPTSPTDCACAWLCLDDSDVAVAGVVIRARPDTDVTGTGYAWSGKTRSATSVAGTGLATINLPQGSKWWIRRDSGVEELFTVPATATTTTVVSVRGGKRDTY